MSQITISTFIEGIIAPQTQQVTIKRKLPLPRSEELPPAKLYLDDVGAITELLKESVSDGESISGEPAKDFLKYRVRDWECDDLAELEKLTRTARNLEIEVRRGHRSSSIRIGPSHTFLEPWVPGERLLGQPSEDKSDL